ncbi:MAG: hypothetical protein JSW15_12625 [Deltaproteobacteria bacterium]|nr:MAG: hypothetical protein JSW15_12625 [Deltaproteobacteria bacterium]
MDVPRKLGTGIILIIPTFVVAGAVWDIFHSWVAVGVWVVIMAIISAATLFRKDIEQLKSYLPRS